MCTLESSVLSLDFSDIWANSSGLPGPEKDIKHSIFLDDMLNYLTSGKSQYILTSSISSFIPGFNINLKQMSWSTYLTNLSCIWDADHYLHHIYIRRDLLLLYNKLYNRIALFSHFCTTKRVIA